MGTPGFLSTRLDPWECLGLVEGKRAPASPDPTLISNLLQVSLSLSEDFRFSSVKRGC